MTSLDDLERRVRALEQEQEQTPLWASAYGVPDLAAAFEVDLNDFDSSPAVGEPWFYNGLSWEKASAADPLTASGVLLVSAVGSQTATMVRTQLGNATISSTAGEVKYLSDTAGDLDSEPGTYRLPVLVGSDDGTADIAIPLEPVIETVTDATRVLIVAADDDSQSTAENELSLAVGAVGATAPRELSFTVTGVCETVTFGGGIATGDEWERYRVEGGLLRNADDTYTLRMILVSDRMEFIASIADATLDKTDGISEVCTVSVTADLTSGETHEVQPHGGSADFAWYQFDVTITDGDEDAETEPTLDLRVESRPTGNASNASIAALVRGVK